MTDDIKAEEAERLRKLFVAAKVNNFAEWAKRHNIPGGKSMVSQHLHQKRPISLECAVAYSMAFQCPISELSPRLAAIIDQLPSPSDNTVLNDVRTPYGAEVVSFPVRRRPLEDELAAISATISDSGLNRLLERAAVIAEQFPRNAASTGN